MAAHSDLTGANLHEPKGVATATVDKVYVSDGAGSGAWTAPTPHGECYFTNFASPSTLTYPSSYTKAAPTTTAGGSAVEVTEGTTAKLTYTGTKTRKFMVQAQVSFSNAGSAAVIHAKLYKNGSAVAGTEVVAKPASATHAQLVTFSKISLATNDYVELYILSDAGSGDISIYSLHLAAVGTIGA